MSNLPLAPTGMMAGANEFSVSATTAKATTELKLRLWTAKEYRRDEEEAADRIINAAVALANEKLGDNYEGVEYVYPRGGTKVRGPSVYFARDAATAWGDIESGHRPLEETEDGIICEAWAWDLQTGRRTVAGFAVKKLIPRRDAKGNLQWVKPDERDLLERINSVGARHVRNCILEVLPRAVVSQAVQAAREAIGASLRKDPKATLQNLVAAFAEIGITKAQLKEYLGHPVTARRVTAEEVADLRGIYRTLRDKNTQQTWEDFTKKDADEPAPTVDFNRMFSKPSEASQAQTGASKGEQAGEPARSAPPPGKETPRATGASEDGKASPEDAGRKAGSLFEGAKGGYPD